MRFFHRWLIGSLLGLLIFWGTGCTSSPIPDENVPVTPTRAGTLRPYHTATPTPSPRASPTWTQPLPSPTPTPIRHVVQKGEDMFGIALRYGIAPQVLLEANPTVNPRAMSVGTVLLIPAVGLPTPTGQVPTPTPQPLTLSEPVCYPALDGGAWCFVTVFNPLSQALEDVVAVIRVSNSAQGEVLERLAYAPLNLLPAGKRIVLSAYFPAPFPESPQMAVELRMAHPVPAEDTRYLPATLEVEAVQIAPDGMSAVLRGNILLEETSALPQTLWVALQAFGESGKPAGIRRVDVPVRDSQRIPFEGVVYSAGAPISSVEALVEARP
ncbi:MULTISPECIES: LysM domain-containing protein [Anaerolinea]|uniref:LysM peptidoglycan-binding domain-containing protein n=1 Tax=Anaerolinea TaxID=233189 RepID=UPI002611B6E8|nr:LysM domain-containing protein [Anaerolinea thermophila]